MAKTQAKQCDRCGYLGRDDDERFRQVSIRKRNAAGKFERVKALDACVPCVEALERFMRPAAQSALGEGGDDGR